MRSSNTSTEKGSAMATRKTFNSYPFADIPMDGKPMTDADCRAALTPLLKGLDVITRLMAEACLHDNPGGEEIHDALVLIAGLLGLASEVVEYSPHARKEE